MSASQKTANSAQMAEQVLDQVMRAGATGDLIIDELENGRPDYSRFDAPWG